METPLLQLTLTPEEAAVLVGRFMEDSARRGRSMIGVVVGKGLTYLVPKDYYASDANAARLAGKLTALVRAAFPHLRGQDAATDAAIDALERLLRETGDPEVATAAGWPTDSGSDADVGGKPRS